MLLLRLRILTLQPRVQLRKKQLTISTSPLLHLLTLGAHSRTVHVDGDARYIHVSERSFWFFTRSRTVACQAIARIRYDFSDLATSWHWLTGVHDTVEQFSIDLELHKTQERIRIATFLGEGAVGSFLTWLNGDDFIDLAGTQESDSRKLVSDLCQLTGLKLSQAREPLKDTQGRAYHCPACNRAVPPKPKCLYCGGKTTVQSAS